MKVFPIELPRPQPDDYEIEEVNNIVRTPMQSGRAVQREEWKEVPELLNMSFIMTHVQTRLFDSFYDLVGSDWFLFPVYGPTGYDEQKQCRFTKKPATKKPIGVTHWRFPCQLEVRQETNLPTDWADLLPSFILHPDIFDSAINIEKPRA
jgi:hypothetical protein